MNRCRVMPMLGRRDGPARGLGDDQLSRSTFPLAFNRFWGATFEDKKH